MLNEKGGHAGNDLQHAAIRRWTAPRDGAVSIRGTLSHGVYQGDGVRGRIVSSQLGELGQWRVHDSKAETKLEQITVKRGDTIDFVTDCYQTVDHDSFDWHATITYSAARPETLQVSLAPESKIKNQKSQGQLTWDSKEDFGSSARLQLKPLSDWEKYAQVLLLANELVFVD